MPVNVVLNILKRYSVLNKFFLKYDQNKLGLLGKVRCYFVRMEMQSRGTLHFHILLWVDGKEQAIEYIRGNQPNEEREKLLGHLVKTRQSHVCEQNCLAKRGGITICKYLYPRRYGVYELEYNKELEMYDYPCPMMQDQYIVPYIPLLLLFCRSKMDIKVFDERMQRQLIRYVSKYISKGSKVKTITTPEAVVNVIGSQLVRESEIVVAIPCNKDCDVAKPLKKIAKIEEIALKDPKNKDIFYPSKHEIYMSRPDNYEDMSFAEYFQKIEYDRKKRANNNTGVQDANGLWIYPCQKEKATMTNVSNTRNLHKQGYFMVKLFYPHRKETDLIIGNKINSSTGKEYTNAEVDLYHENFNWVDSYRQLVWLNPIIKDRMLNTNAYKFIELIKKIQMNKRSGIDSSESTLFIDELNKMFSEKKDSADLSEIKLKLKKFESEFNKCTDEQKKVICLISVYLEEYYMKRQIDYGIAIQGAAGTGKSFVIKVVRKLCKILELVCEVLAPTGILF